MNYIASFVIALLATATAYAIIRAIEKRKR